jgi:glycine cleavage system H protein
MSTTPENLLFSESHEWVRRETDGIVTIGISDHAQQALGDLVYLELPEAGVQVNSGDEVAVVESVKAASDIYSPVSGEIIAVNDDAAEAPEILNESCYDKGWLFKVKLTDETELEQLHNAESYQQLCSEA